MMKQTINKISQIKINDVKQNIDVAAILKDRAPKENSTNVITSGAVYTAIENLTTKDIIDENRNVDFSFNAEGALTSDMASDATNNLIVGQNNVINGVNSFVAGSSNKINNKGYHYKSYTKTVIQKDDKDVECYELELTSDCSEYAVGDQYCLTTVPYTDNKGNLVKGHHFAFCGELLKIEGNKVIVDHMPWTEHIGESITEEGLEAKLALDPTDRDGNAVFWVPTKPNAGDFLLGSNSLVVGEDNVNSGRASAVVGRKNIIGDAYAFAAGRENKVGYAGFVAGRANSATADYSAAFGNHCTATGRYAIAFGSQSNTAANYGIAGGYKAKVESGGDASVALGLEATAQGVGDIALNNGKTLVKKYTDASNNQYFTYNFAANKATVESGTLNAAFGTSKITGGDYSLVTGDGNEIKAGYSLVGGYKCKSFGAVNFVFGQEAVAGAPVDIALIKGQTYESDKWSYNAAIGYDAKVSAGQFNMALIGGKVTGGNYRLAANKATATEECAIALGDYNKGENLFEIGNGTSRTPSNAFSVDSSGNVLAAGKITAGQNPDPTQPMDVVTIDYFNNNATKVEWENIDSDVRIINEHDLNISGDLNIEGNARINGELEFSGNFEFNNIVANDSIAVKKAPTEDEHVVTLGYLKNEYEMPSLTWDNVSGKPFTNYAVRGDIVYSMLDAGGEYMQGQFEGVVSDLFKKGTSYQIVKTSADSVTESIYEFNQEGEFAYISGYKYDRVYAFDGTDDYTGYAAFGIDGLGGGDWSLEVYSMTVTSGPILEEYIPDTIARKSDLGVTWANISGKPFTQNYAPGEPVVVLDWADGLLFTDSVSDARFNNVWYTPGTYVIKISDGHYTGGSTTYIEAACTCTISEEEYLGYLFQNYLFTDSDGNKIAETYNEYVIESGPNGDYPNPTQYIKFYYADAINDYYYKGEICTAVAYETLNEDVIPDTIARIADAKDYTNAKLCSISWNDLIDTPFSIELSRGSLIATSHVNDDFGSDLYVRLDNQSFEIGASYLIELKSQYGDYDPSFKKAVYKFDGSQLIYIYGDKSTIEDFDLENNQIYLGHFDSGGVDRYGSIYNCTVTMGPILEEYIPDTIASSATVEALEAKHNADIAALQATIATLQAKIDALTNASASGQ